ncbi:MAG: hypothetical protein HOP36_05930 [Methyloglobulus sp.]|nr:hypothetical protein [Methyloglobulus sp.]
MQKNLTTSSALVLALFFSAFFIGCTSNIKHIPKSEAQAPKSQAYNTPVDAVWNAAKKALVEDETFKIMDKSSGIMVTELRVIYDITANFELNGNVAGRGNMPVHL